MKIIAFIFLLFAFLVSVTDILAYGGELDKMSNSEREIGKVKCTYYDQILVKEKKFHVLVIIF